MILATERWHFHFRRTTTKAAVDFRIISLRLRFFDFDVCVEDENQTSVLNSFSHNYVSHTKHS
jgi:hypothetical protein